MSRPRILCLHGACTNAAVFRLQARALITALAPHVRLVFVDAPHPSPPHPAIAPFFGDMGPFYRWIRPGQPFADAAPDILQTLRRAMADDDDDDDYNRHNGSHDDAPGPWAGLLGFSEGAAVAAALLYLQPPPPPDATGTASPPDALPARLRFGVLLAGHAPRPRLADADASLYAGVDRWLAGRNSPPPLQVPTLHVHGLQDDQLALNRSLVRDFCDPATARVLEWDGDHRLPLRPADVASVVDAILDLSGLHETIGLNNCGRIQNGSTARETANSEPSLDVPLGPIAACTKNQGELI